MTITGEEKVLGDRWEGERLMTVLFCGLMEADRESKDGYGDESDCLTR
jgi:hypothetical protein